jgi:hypothetical protein
MSRYYMTYFYRTISGHQNKQQSSYEYVSWESFLKSYNQLVASQAEIKISESIIFVSRGDPRGPLDSELCVDV